LRHNKNPLPEFFTNVFSSKKQRYFGGDRQGATDKSKLYAQCINTSATIKSQNYGFRCDLNHTIDSFGSNLTDGCDAGRPGALAGPHRITGDNACVSAVVGIGEKTKNQTLSPKVSDPIHGSALQRRRRFLIVGPALFETELGAKGKPSDSRSRCMVSCGGEVV
jgi:hypothetical protein